MRDTVDKNIIINTIQSFADCNDGDEATTEIILAIGADLLGISTKEMEELIHG